MKAANPADKADILSSVESETFEQVGEAVRRLDPDTCEQAAPDISMNADSEGIGPLRGHWEHLMAVAPDIPLSESAALSPDEVDPFHADWPHW